uniref:Tryptophan-rich sensory protein n=1 Tax=candidate division CPR3 bacterium TaxID=2268181 RepID=A0A7C4M0L6_UNCC3
MKNTITKVLAGVVYIAMITVNFLAGSSMINNRSTGDISDAYQNLFAPAGITFSIWGLIYLLLAGYVVYQFVLIGKKVDKKKEETMQKVNLLFIATSLANIAWIFAWHYDVIWLSIILMLALLVLLIKITDILRGEKMTKQEKVFISTPFSIYFGWITVATIANTTVFLLSLGWNGSGIAEYIWASIIILVGALIGILRMNKDKNIAYGLVLIWAYLGILLKHLSASGFNGQYPLVIATVVLCLISFGFFIGKTVYKK